MGDDSSSENKINELLNDTKLEKQDVDPVAALQLKILQLKKGKGAENYNVALIGLWILLIISLVILLWVLFGMAKKTVTVMQDKIQQTSSGPIVVKEEKTTEEKLSKSYIGWIIGIMILHGLSIYLVLVSKYPKYYSLGAQIIVFIMTLGTVANIETTGYLDCKRNQDIYRIYAAVHSINVVLLFFSIIQTLTSVMTVDQSRKEALTQAFNASNKAGGAYSSTSDSSN
jgi:hypothetical protein